MNLCHRSPFKNFVSKIEDDTIFDNIANMNPFRHVERQSQKCLLNKII